MQITLIIALANVNFEQESKSDRNEMDSALDPILQGWRKRLDADDDDDESHMDDSEPDKQDDQIQDVKLKRKRASSDTPSPPSKFISPSIAAKSRRTSVYQAAAELARE